MGRGGDSAPGGGGGLSSHPEPKVGVVSLLLFCDRDLHGTSVHLSEGRVDSHPDGSGPTHRCLLGSWVVIGEREVPLLLPRRFLTPHLWSPRDTLCRPPTGPELKIEEGRPTHYDYCRPSRGVRDGETHVHSGLTPCLTLPETVTIFRGTLSVKDTGFLPVVPRYVSERRPRTSTSPWISVCHRLLERPSTSRH